MAYIGRDIQYGTLDKQSFTANSSTTVFTLNTTVKDAKSLLVSVGGVIQEPDVAYTASGTTLTFSEAPVTGNIVYVIYLGKELIAGATRESISYQSGTGNNTTTPVTLSAAANNAQSIMVMLNGVTQTPETDYTVNGTTLTFNEAVPNGVAILVYHLANQAQAFAVNDASVTNAHIVSLDASKLTGNLPGSMGVNTTTLDQSIASLGLHVGVSENKIAYNLPEAYIDVFQDDSGILTQTNVDRLTDEYVASTYTSLGAATYWPYTSDATQTIVDGGNNMNGVPAADNWSVINQGSWPTYLGYWMNSFSYASTYMYVDYLAQYRWTGLKISWHAAHSIVATWRLEHSNDGTNWTVMDQTGTTHAEWTGQGFTSGHDDIVTGIDTATGVFTNSNPGHSASKGGSIITFGTPVTSRYLRVGVASIHTNLGDPTAALGAFIPQYQPLTTSTNPTGTLISKASTAASTVSTASGVMLYEDAEGTGTLGTDLKVHFSSDDGANWTEAASYGNSMGFSGNIKMVPLGSTSLSGGTGTAVKMKAEWANQAAGTPGGNVQIAQNVGTGIGDPSGSEGGGIAAGFDGNTSQATTSGFVSASSATGYLGKDWGDGVTKTISKAILYPSTYGGGVTHCNGNVATAFTCVLQGSNDNSTWADLQTFTNQHSNSAGTLTFDSPVTTTAYRYHRVYLTNGSGNTTWSELELFESTPAVDGKVQRLHGWAVNY